MMGVHVRKPRLYNPHLDLERRVRANHPLRRVAAAVDFAFVRVEVAHLYGSRGHESVDPVIVLKLMFLLFYDDIASERELMAMLPERLDYLWFLGYELEEKLPGPSVLSKARRRWGKAVFTQLFIRTIQQCQTAGLITGEKLHVDSSLVRGNASQKSVRESSPEIIALYAAAYEVVEKKLNDPADRPCYKPINDRTISTTDPDTSLVSKGGRSSQPAYHHHRAIDDFCGVITAIETTSGSIAENKKLMSLVQAHEKNLGGLPAVLVADHKYGTAENYVACHQAGLVPHLGDAKVKAGKVEGIFPESQFHYQAQDDTFVCPAQKTLRRRRFVERQRVWEYAADKGVCPACPLRSQCTRSKTARTLSRHEHADILEHCRAQANSPAAKSNRRRRQHLMERSFGDAANNHGFKRSRWRRLWRQQIQDYLIAAIQNIRILLSEIPRRATPGAAIALEELACVN